MASGGRPTLDKLPTNQLEAATDVLRKGQELFEGGRAGELAGRRAHAHRIARWERRR